MKGQCNGHLVVIHSYCYNLFSKQVITMEIMLAQMYYRLKGNWGVLLQISLLDYYALIMFNFQEEYLTRKEID